MSEVGRGKTLVLRLLFFFVFFDGPSDEMSVFLFLAGDLLF